MLRDLARRVDAAADHAIDTVRSPVLDHAAYALGSACDHSLLWHAIGAVRAAQSGDAAPAVRLSGALAIESLLTNVVVKSLFKRVRPAHETKIEGPLPYGMRVPVTTSFPSGHAGAAFCAAAILADETGHRAWYALAATVAATRVYVRMHHATDVLGGAVLGYTLARALRVACDR